MKRRSWLMHPLLLRELAAAARRDGEGHCAYPGFRLALVMTLLGALLFYVLENVWGAHDKARLVFTALACLQMMLEAWRCGRICAAASFAERRTEAVSVLSLAPVAAWRVPVYRYACRVMPQIVELLLILVFNLLFYCLWLNYFPAVCCVALFCLQASLSLALAGLGMFLGSTAVCCGYSQNNEPAWQSYDSKKVSHEAGIKICTLLALLLSLGGLGVIGETFCGWLFLPIIVGIMLLFWVPVAAPRLSSLASVLTIAMVLVLPYYKIFLNENASLFNQASYLRTPGELAASMVIGDLEQDTQLGRQFDYPNFSAYAREYLEDKAVVLPADEDDMLLRSKLGSFFSLNTEAVPAFAWELAQSRARYSLPFSVFFAGSGLVLLGLASCFRRRL